MGKSSEENAISEPYRKFKWTLDVRRRVKTEAECYLFHG